MKTRALLLALPLLALGPAGCVDNRASLSIHGICAIPDACTFSGACEAFALSTPAIDAATSATGLLRLYLEVENQLPNNADENLKRTNTNDAHVDEYVIEYEGIVLPRQVIGAQQLVPAAGTAVVRVDVIPTTMAPLAALAAYASTPEEREMTAVLRLRGYYDDGTRFETGEFPIAVRVCSGCIGSCANPANTCPPAANGQTPIKCGT